jgi:hypothetical protein
MYVCHRHTRVEIVDKGDSILRTLSIAIRLGINNVSIDNRFDPFGYVSSSLFPYKS